MWGGGGYMGQGRCPPPPCFGPNLVFFSVKLWAEHLTLARPPIEPAYRGPFIDYVHSFTCYVD